MDPGRAGLLWRDWEGKSRECAAQRSGTKHLSCSLTQLLHLRCAPPVPAFLQWPPESRPHCAPHTPRLSAVGCAFPPSVGTPPLLHRPASPYRGAFLPGP